MMDFTGVKIALIKDDRLLVIQRDNKPGLRYAGMWDLPGGGREDNETPFECMAREVNEELGLTLSPQSVIWEKTYHTGRTPSQIAYFMVAHINDIDIRSVIFGDEGQGWKMIKIDEFMVDKTVVEPLKTRLNDYLASLA